MASVLGRRFQPAALTEISGCSEEELREPLAPALAVRICSRKTRARDCGSSTCWSARRFTNRCRPRSGGSCTSARRSACDHARIAATRFHGPRLPSTSRSLGTRRARRPSRPGARRPIRPKRGIRSTRRCATTARCRSPATPMRPTSRERACCSSWRRRRFAPGISMRDGATVQRPFKSARRSTIRHCSPTRRSRMEAFSRSAASTRGSSGC